MRETNRYSAIHSGIRELNFCGTDFNPDVHSLSWEFLISRHYGGVIILPSSNEKGFEIAKYSSSVVDVKDDGVTVDDLWDCTKEHYGLTAATGIIGAASIPIKKIKLGHYVAPGSSKYTNLSSHIGVKFFPRAVLRSGSASAKAAKATFGTIRVFGIIGRALPFAAIGLAVYDIISIGQCVYKKS
ncbi:MAG: hypothetical protein L3J84_14095 [Gammaproteobacteria bacterium]|nr:hypothetical protein [Gammaproteobacteria bacterium]